MAHYSYPAAPDLETVRDFVNTVHYEQGEVDEQLATPEALAAFLAERGLLAGGTPVKPADLRRALDVREALRALAGANNGEPVDPDAVELLNRTAARARLAAGFGADGSSQIAPAAAGVDGALGSMLATVLRAMGEGTWSRMKACGNPDCRWVFNDASKNQSARWCEMASCGNRMKARRFRERARQAAER